MGIVLSIIDADLCIREINTQSQINACNKMKTIRLLPVLVLMTILFSCNNPAWTADRIKVEILPSDNYKIIGSTFYGDEFLCPVDLENNKFYPPFSGNVYVF